MLKLLNLALLACLACTAASAQTPQPLVTIASLDVPRYMGVWYEIAKYPNRFQKKCIADTKAEYRLMPEGTVQVTNRCRMASGELDEAIGEARQIGNATSPTLQVRFAPAWLSVFPFVWGNYWVIDLDAGYQLAAVSEPKREFLWILSRTPTVSADVYDALVARLQRAGFDPQRLEKSPQTP
jgi:apolipoprotein D and lipocalin family protein